MKYSKELRSLALFIFFLIVAAGCGGGQSDGPTSDHPPLQTSDDAPTLTGLASMLAAESRPEADRARDAGRRPAAVVEFLGIKPGMTVIDIIAASGYYTEVLSVAVGPDGKVTAQNPASALQRRDGANDKALAARLADGRLANVARLDAEIAELSPDAGLYDAGLTALNLHDIYNGTGEEVAIGAMQLFFSILKPGGVFGVIDHEGASGNDNKALHRIEKADAIRIAQAAGFVVEAESSVLQNPADDMSQGPFTEGLRGNTNRFLIRLRKPE